MCCKAQQFFAGRKRQKISFTDKEHLHHKEARELDFDSGMTGKVRSPRTIDRFGWDGDCNGEKLERADVQHVQPDLT